MASFSQIYDQYAEQVYCFLRELSGNDGLAEELTWKTFYQAFLHVDSFENRSSVFGWLCEIGEKVYLKEMRRQKGKCSRGKRQNTVLEGEAFGGQADAAERKIRLRQGLRRIRRRWACSVMAAGIILLLLMGVLLIVGGVPEI